ncbi:MAG: glutamate racemase [Acidocella sp.]|nr:glutamate racemase [Acidocella sp.]
MILVFDSGIGGLGVVRQIRRHAAHLPLAYLADNGFYPYGEKSDEVLLARVVKLLGEAIKMFNPSAVVLACNTASTIALATLRQTHRVPFVGCVPPIKPAAAASQSRQLGLLATPATIRRPYLQDLLDKFADDCQVHSLGTPLLADMAEAKFRGEAVDLAALEAAVAPMFTAGPTIDAVALGCTHYTFLLNELKVLYPGVMWFDPAGPVARQTEAVVARQELVANGPERAFFTAKLPDLDMMKAALADYGFSEVMVAG